MRKRDRDRESTWGNDDSSKIYAMRHDNAKVPVTYQKQDLEDKRGADLEASFPQTVFHGV